MALVAATIMGTLRAGFALFPDFASQRPVKKYAASAALVAIAVYLFISGSAVAAERSFIMLAVMLTALLFDRAALTMRNLAIAALVVIALSPHEVAGPSFQMSFAATAALIGAYAWLVEPADETCRHAERFPPSARRQARPKRPLLCRRPRADVADCRRRNDALWRIPFPAHFAVQPCRQPCSDAGRLGRCRAGCGARHGRDAVRARWPGLRPDGQRALRHAGDRRWFSQRSPLDAVGIVPPGAVIILTIALAISALSTTWLRLAALPLLCVGLIWIGGRQTPDVLVSEDARLVAMRLADENVARKSHPAELIHHA